MILAMLAKIAPETYVFNLDTGYQFQETLDLRDRIAEKYGIEVDLLTPDLSVREYEALQRRAALSHESESMLLRSEDQNTAAGVGSDARLDERHSPRSESRSGSGQDRWLGQEVRPGEDQPAGQLDEERRLEADHRRVDSLQSAARPGLSEHRLLALHAGRGGRRNRRTGRPLERHEEDRVRPAFD